MKVYLSGPITGTNDHEERFNTAREVIERSGHTVINPQPLGEVLPKDAEHADFMYICFALLDLANCIYMMSGWENSKGARMEFDYAVRNGITVVFQK